MIRQPPLSRLPSSRMRQPTRAVATLVAISFASAVVLSLLLVDLWQPDQSSSVWRVGIDVAVGLSLALLTGWLTKRTITQLETTEQALRHGEQLYRTLIENQGEGICFVDENENLTFANPAR